ncbi:unnamed protein product [Nezara viridula]|uniref:Uncharacterized protein n=1 Tax=Nezara viridula TaxID=85310 RepID=A0A9P0E5Y2_NEZVI|nr:unnamed protein product [Nezara viridula]
MSEYSEGMREEIARRGANPMILQCSSRRRKRVPSRAALLPFLVKG